MAEFLLAFAVEQILKKVGSIAVDDSTRAWGLKSDLQKLSQTTRRIQAVLQDAEDKEAADDRVKPWLLKLQDIIYSADDVLDEFSYEILRRKVEIQRQLKLRVCNFLTSRNHILFLLKMAQKVKKINQSLAEIEKQAIGELALSGIANVDRGIVLSNKLDRVTDSFINTSESMIGRTSEVEAIINMLKVSSSNPPLLTIISVVGIGGLGKTTLAKLVLEEVRKKNLFDETIWVFVSDTFDDKIILRGILETLDKSTGGLSSIDAILQHLQKRLENKRFLLVLDDVWNGNPKKCNSLKQRLQNICRSNCNFIIVTTRSRSVVNIMETSPHHVLELTQLQDEECWLIIKEKVIGKEGESITRELEAIGIEIAKKCGGVPLAAKVLGGTLCS